MFLIGITGSFLPYLILLGMAFLFSMQVTSRPDDGVFNSDETSVASNHQLFVPATSLLLSDVDYLVVCDIEQCASECLLNGSGVMHIPDCNLLVDITKWPVIVVPKVDVDVLFSGQLFEFSFSGLSPPVTMS
ncbi:hypothetical protein [Marinilabilia salmonicolor]|jgi:hypothetical protein|uniref:Uncharacterized protein n=1 Tax=Marinilabilia salmonicolor TaxID=989 RepID=A0A368UPB7_9BACT|nr:hypothetical protein [Marinilabilia salmonicolor]RCW30636.1 hypothetical protein DFO77_12173 [Marinilabilia salmonicolor]